MLQDPTRGILRSGSTVRETYGTQNAIALLTQHFQYGSVFDRTDLGMRKHLMDLQYAASMNPTAGSLPKALRNIRSINAICS